MYVHVLVTSHWTFGQLRIFFQQLSHNHHHHHHHHQQPPGRLRRSEAADWAWRTKTTRGDTWTGSSCCCCLSRSANLTVRTDFIQTHTFLNTYVSQHSVSRRSCFALWRRLLPLLVAVWTGSFGLLKVNRSLWACPGGADWTRLLPGTHPEPVLVCGTLNESFVCAPAVKSETKPAADELPAAAPDAQVRAVAACFWGKCCWLAGCRAALWFDTWTTGRVCLAGMFWSWFSTSSHISHSRSSSAGSSQTGSSEKNASRSSSSRSAAASSPLWEETAAGLCGKFWPVFTSDVFDADVLCLVPDPETDGLGWNCGFCGSDFTVLGVCQERWDPALTEALLLCWESFWFVSEL